MNQQTPAQAKTLLGKILRESFPGVAFRVYIRTTHEIGVKWTDGPSEQAVAQIIDIFRGGYFDAGRDLYEYSGTYYVLDRSIRLASFHWTRAERTTSPEARAAAIEKYNATYQRPFDDDHYSSWDWRGLQEDIEEDAEAAHPAQPAPTMDRIVEINDGDDAAAVFARMDREEIAAQISAPNAQTRAPRRI